jgi:hypothetical protein
MVDMKANNLNSAVEKVIHHLKANGFTAEADELEQLLAEAVASEAARKAIYDRCHIKWLGDLPIQEMTLEEWLGLLEEVKAAAV